MNGVALPSCGRGAPVNQNHFSLLVCGPSISAPILGGEFSLDVIEAGHIRKILSRTNTFSIAARVLGIEPLTLWGKR